MKSQEKKKNIAYLHSEYWSSVRRIAYCDSQQHSFQRSKLGVSCRLYFDLFWSADFLAFHLRSSDLRGLFRRLILVSLCEKRHAGKLKRSSNSMFCRIREYQIDDINSSDSVRLRCLRDNPAFFLTGRSILIVWWIAGNFFQNA